MITWVVGPAKARWSPNGDALWHPVDERASWTSPAGDIAATCFIFEAEKLPGQRQLSRSEDRIAALTGWPLTNGIDLDQSVSELECKLAEASGSFTWFSLEAGPSGTFGRVGSDALSTGLLYTAQTPDGPLWSNDAGILGELLGARPDMFSPVWNAYSSFWLDDSTSLDGVQTVPPGKSVRVEAGRFHLDGPPNVWLSVQPGHPEDHLDELAEGIKATIQHTAATTAKTRSLGLTGGKDSRMVLAAILAVGAKDAFEFQTTGDPSDPDVVVAGMLAERFNLRWERQDPVALAMDADEFDVRLRTHVFATRGMLNGWTLKGLGAPHDQIGMTGQFGELQRSNFGALNPDLPLVQGLLRRIHADAGGLLSAEARERADQTVHDLVDRMLSDGVAADDVIEAIFVDRRLRRWFGTAQQINQVNVTGMPLMQPAALKLGRSLSPAERDSGVGSLKLIERLLPAALEVPMAVKPWSAQAVAAARNAPLAGQAPVTGTQRTIGVWQETLWGVTGPVLVHRLTDSAALGPLFDPDRMALALRDYRRTPRHGRVSLWGAATSAMWVDGAWSVRKMRRSGQPPDEVAPSDELPPTFPVPSSATVPPGRAWPEDPDPNFSRPMVLQSELAGAVAELERTSAKLELAESKLNRTETQLARLQSRKVVKFGLRAADGAGRIARLGRRPT